jgi:hypothetical protein
MLCTRKYKQCFIFGKLLSARWQTNLTAVKIIHKKTLRKNEVLKKKEIRLKNHYLTRTAAGILPATTVPAQLEPVAKGAAAHHLAIRAQG